MALGRNLRLAGLAFLLWSLAYNINAPLLPLFTGSVGGEAFEVGLVAGAGAAGALVMVFPLSMVSDRFGRRSALLAGWVLSAIGVLLMAGATSWQGLLPGTFLSLAGAAALPTLNALILEESPPEWRARSFALLYAAGPLGLLGGSALGGLVAELYGLRMAVLVAGLCSLTATLAVIPIKVGAPPEAVSSHQRSASRPSRGPLAHIAFGSVAAVGFLFVTLPSNFIVPYLREVEGQSLLSTGLHSSLLAAAQLGWSLLFTVWPRTSGHVRVGYKQTYLTLPTSTLVGVAVCLAACGAFGLLLPIQLPGIPLLALILRGSQYTLQGLGSSLLGDVVSPGPSRTVRMTAFNAAVGLGAVGAPIASGWLYGLGPAFPFWVSGVASAGGALMVAAALIYLPREAPRSMDSEVAHFG